MNPGMCDSVPRPCGVVFWGLWFGSQTQVGFQHRVGAPWVPARRFPGDPAWIKLNSGPRCQKLWPQLHILTFMRPWTGPFLSLDLSFLHWLECSLLGSFSLFSYEVGWCRQIKALKPDQSRFKSKVYHCAIQQVLISLL